MTVTAVGAAAPPAARALVAPRGGGAVPRGSGLGRVLTPRGVEGLAWASAPRLGPRLGTCPGEAVHGPGWPSQSLPEPGLSPRPPEVLAFGGWSVCAQGSEAGLLLSACLGGLGAGKGQPGFAPSGRRKCRDPESKGGGGGEGSGRS